MNGAGTPPRRGLERLPPWLRPREAQERPRGRTRLVESTLLLLTGLLLAVATVNDIVLSTHTNHRLVADLRTWRSYTGHDYVNLSAEQDQRHHTTVDVICGNTTPGPPKERIQLCLQMTGPVIHSRRAARGGWYLPAKAEDLRHSRYGCFGEAKSAGLCGPAAAGEESPEGLSPETGQ